MITKIFFLIDQHFVSADTGADYLVSDIPAREGMRHQTSTSSIHHQQGSILYPPQLDPKSL
jgi:hypothetical protein